MYEVLGLKPENTKRIVFHEITKNAILHAIETPRDININLVNAQQARRVLDRIVGFELSPILWRKVKPALSAGRVQSVAVRLIVEREREINEFVSEAAFRVIANFILPDGTTVLKAELNRRLKDKKEVEAFLESCKNASFTIDDITTKPVKKSPAPPFTTSTLQQEAARKLGYSVSQTMMIAQRLYERSDNPDYRNGVKQKKLRSSYGEIPIDVPQDRDGDFEPQIVPKRKKDISEIEQKIIAMSAKGMTTRQISDIVEDIYGFEVSESMVTAVTNKILPQIEEWQQRPLSAVYPIVFIDAIHFSVRDEHIVKKIAAYIILGVNDEGKKEVLSITIGENESAKYWLGVLNELKNRGVRDILILCADGLSGIKESIAAAYPNTEYQRCIVHQVRNTLKYVAEKDKKAFANDLKSIYHAPNEESGYERMQSVTKKWQEKYPNAMRRWEENWDVLSPMFKFSAEVRKVMYTTNAIESLNSVLRRLNSQRSVFPSDTALLKALYLATFEATKKWTMPLRNWGRVYGELSIMYDGRLV